MHLLPVGIHHICHIFSTDKILGSIFLHMEKMPKSQWILQENSANGKKAKIYTHIVCSKKKI